MSVSPVHGEGEGEMERERDGEKEREGLLSRGRDGRRDDS